MKSCTINCIVIVPAACCGQLRVKVETRSVSLNRKLTAFTNEFLFSPLSRTVLEKLIMPSSDQEIPPHLKELECSLPHAQDPATCPYPEPDQSITCPSHFLKIHFPPAESHVPCLLLSSYQRISPSSRLREVVSNVVALYGEELLAFRQTPKLEDHPMSVVRDWIFLYSALHFGGRSSIQYLRTRRALVTGTLLMAIK